jgi:hypothetical protein
MDSFKMALDLYDKTQKRSRRLATLVGYAKAELRTLIEAHNLDEVAKTKAENAIANLDREWKQIYDLK